LKDIQQKIESILGENILSSENIEQGIVEVTVDPEPNNRIEYDFEIELETRYVIEAQDPTKYHWENHL
jgi:hypothetical protein